jgi:endonuclease/exonuclease/phosphatase family metal-dependent hydrolase
MTSILARQQSVNPFVGRRRNQRPYSFNVNIVAAIVLAACCVGTPASAQTLGPADPCFWVVLPDGSRVPYNHPLATGAQPPSAPVPASPAPSAILGPSDPGFWVTLPNGALVPYNHPDAIAARGSAAPPATTPSPESVPPPAVEPSGGGVALRVLQWNLHHGVGTDGRYDVARLASWMAKLQPDVIMLNEVEKNTGWGNEDQPERYRALLQQLTGREWHALFAQEFGNWNASGKGHLILSTYPFESTSRQAISYDRVIGAAGINVHGRTVTLVITHLDPESHSRRLTQAGEVIAWASSLAENRILTGDMNAWPDQSSIAELNQHYRDSWLVAGQKGRSAQPSGLTPDGATRKGRIDYIFYSKSATALSVSRSEVLDTRDSRKQMPSDHRPVLTTFQVN